MDRRLQTQWEAERLPERAENLKDDVLNHALKDYNDALAYLQEYGLSDGVIPSYREIKLHAYFLYTKGQPPEIE